MKLVPMVSLLLSIAALAAPAPVQAQVLCALGQTTTPYNAMADMPPSAAAQADLKKVKSLLCPKSCGKVLLFANTTTPNTATVTDGEGNSKISYSPAFLNSVRENYGPAATLGILAHELGHHLEATGNKAHWMDIAWDAELRADAWAGCALAKAEVKGATIDTSVEALSTYPSPNSAPWAARLPVIQAGYAQCGGRTLASLSKKEEASQKVAKKDDPGSTSGGGAPGGCTGDRDCRNGRICANSHCAYAPRRRACGKDTDCPEPQECSAAGYCAGPGGFEPAAPEPSQGEQKAPAKPAETQLAMEDHRPRVTQAQPAAEDPAACVRSCEDRRNQCIESANGEVNRCIGAIQSEPNYRACSCPNYPSGNYGCYRYCSSAYEQGKTCAAKDQVNECRSEADRCRAQCTGG